MMKKENSVQFIVATDKPKESTNTYRFRPFFRIYYNLDEHEDSEAKYMENLIDEVNHDLKAKFHKRSICYADILPFDLKNLEQIPEEIIERHIDGVLLDIHALGKEEYFDKLCDLVFNWRELKNAGPKTPIFNPFFVRNDINEITLEKLKQIFEFHDYLRWNPCNKYEDLKSAIREFTTARCYSKIYILAGAFGDRITNKYTMEAITQMLLNIPPDVLKSIRFDKFTKTNEETGEIIEIDREKEIEEFSSKTEFGQWFLKNMASEITKNPEKYFYPNTEGFGSFVPEKLKLKKKPELEYVKNILESQINDIILEKRTLNLVFKELKDDFERIDISLNMPLLRDQIRKQLVGVRDLYSPSAKKGEVINAVLEGKLVVYLRPETQLVTISEQEKCLLNSFGIDFENNVRVIPNTIEIMAKLKPIMRMVEIAQFREVEGNLDIVNFPKIF